MVEPMFAKMVLPHLGGSAAVWTTCMLFYQCALLVGYLYAHWLARRVPSRAQVFIHAALFVGAFLSLPIAVPDGWRPSNPAQPVGSLLLLLLQCIAAPFVLLSAGSSLLQHWFGGLGSTRDASAYSLYGASNAGSVVALLSYPFIIERSLTLKHQATFWLAGYGLLIAFLVVCGWLSARGAEPLAVSPSEASDPRERISGRRRIKWLVLSAVPSSLLLGVTSHITTDLAAIPLVWVVPLALYLTTFIIAFSGQGPSNRRFALVALPYLALSVAALMFLGGELPGPLGYLVHLLTFFVCALACHWTLADSRPGLPHLTEFYVWLAVGGAIGGVLNVLIAPRVFSTVAEYPLAIVAALALQPSTASGRRINDVLIPLVTALGVAGVFGILSLVGIPLNRPWLGVVVGASALVAFAYRRRSVRFALGVVVIMSARTVFARRDGHTRLSARSFYGVYRIVDDSAAGRRYLYSGTTIHGSEGLADSGRVPLAYYHRDGPLGALFATMTAQNTPQRVGVIGLGVGAAAAYIRPGDAWTFYEIDPLVAQIAEDRRFFTFLAAASAPPRIVIGDGRLSLALDSLARFDVLVVDAFSSDAIPTHLLTREALAVYRSHLSDDGLIAWHISNKYVDLRPVLHALATDAQLADRVFEDLSVSSSNTGRLPSVWIVMTSSSKTIAAIGAHKGWTGLETAGSTPVWRDDFSDLVDVLR